MEIASGLAAFSVCCYVIRFIRIFKQISWPAGPSGGKVKDYLMPEE